MTVSTASIQTKKLFQIIYILLLWLILKEMKFIVLFLTVNGEAGFLRALRLQGQVPLHFSLCYLAKQTPKLFN